MNEDEKYKEGLEEDLKAIKKLKKIGDSQELNDYFNFVLDTVAKKITLAFTSEGIKSWDEFLKLRGEIVAYLYPIQEIRGAEAAEKQIKDQLNQYYGKNI